MAEIPPNPATPARPARRRKPLILKLLLILLALPVVLAMLLAVQFLVQRQSAWDFIPKQFQVYLQVPSISKVFDEWNQLDALHLAIRENPSLAGLEKPLLALKASGASDSALFRTLIDVQAHLVVTRQNQPVIILDLGWRSALTRQLPLFGGWINLKGLTITQKNGRAYFQYTWAKDSTVYGLFFDNLVLVSFKLETLESLLSLKSAGLALSDMEKTRISQEFATTNTGSVRFLADPGSLATTFITDTELSARLTDNLTWKDSALVSLDISNQAFSMQAATVLESKQEVIAKLLTHKNTVLNSLRSVPASTYFYTALSLGDFRQLLQAWTLFSGQKLDTTLTSVESGAQLLFGLSTDDLLWSWIGEEAGLLYLGANGDPVIHLKIKDENKRQLVFQKLASSIVVNIDKSLVLDNVAINRIVIPDFIKGILGIFGVAFDNPYYLVLDDTLYFSMNAENLARLSNESRAGKLLYRTPEFEHLLATSAKNPALFLYYDLEKSVPFFLQKTSLLSKVLRLYNRGALSLYVNDGYLSLNMSAIRVEQRKTVAYPGFPLAIKGGLSSAPWIGYLPGRSDPVIASIQNGSELTLDALAGGERIFSAPVEAGSRLLPPVWGSDLMAWAPTGTFYRFDTKGIAVAPFPVLSPTQGSFTPVQFADKLLAFSRSDQALLTVAKDGSLTTLPTTFDAPVLTPPSLRGTLAAFGPKTFEGSVYLIDTGGKLQPGWPREGNGISLSGPVLIDSPEGMRVAFLTQNGKLSLWNLDGSDCPGFPLDLKAVCAAPPVAVRISGQTVLGLLDQAGSISLIKLDGSLLRAGQIASANAETRLLCQDVDADGTDEIFAYGGKNTLDGLDSNLVPLPGFPVRGSYQPQFVDLNLDGKAELVAGSYDGNVYAYTIKK